MSEEKVIAARKRWNFKQYSLGYWLFSILWLSAICWLAFLWHLGDTGLVDETEPLFAEAARQMTVTGDWITPYFNGVTRFDKPPLIYWLMAIGYELFGVNTWAVRLPSAIAAIALGGFCFATLRYFGLTTPQPKFHLQLWISAWIGSALVVLNFQTIVWARTGVSDMLLSSTMGGALLCFFWGYAQGGKKPKRQFLPVNVWYWAFYLLIALAILTKGPVGIVLPGLIIFTFLLYVGKLGQVLGEMGIFAGGIVLMVITAPWFIAVTVRHGSAYTDTFFGYHNFERFTEVVNGHEAPWYFYFLIVLGLFAPWSVYLPAAIARLRFWKLAYWRSQPRFTHLGIFALFWFTGIFSFFSISVTKLPSYTLPLIPAAAIMVALLWSEEFTKFRAKQGKIRYIIVSSWFNVLILVILAFACFSLPDWLGNDPAVPDEAELLRDSNLPLRGGMIWAATAIVISVFLVAKTGRRWLLTVNLVGFIAFLVFVLNPASFFVDQTRQLPLRRMAEVVTQVQQPGEEIWMVGFNKPSVVFYSQRPVRFFKTNSSLKDYIDSQIKSQSAPPTVLLISRPKRIRSFKLQPQNYQRLLKKGAYQLIRVPPQQIRQSNS